MKFIFSLLVAVIVGSLSCSAADLDTVDNYSFDPVTMSALDYGVSLASATSWDTADQAHLAAIRNALTYSSTVSGGSVFGWVQLIGQSFKDGLFSDILTELEDISSGAVGTSNSILWYAREIYNDTSELHNIYLSASSSALSLDEIESDTGDINTTVLQSFYKLSDLYSLFTTSQRYDYTVYSTGGSSFLNLTPMRSLIYIATHLSRDATDASGIRTLYSRVKELQEVAVTPFRRDFDYYHIDNSSYLNMTPVGYLSFIAMNLSRNATDFNGVRTLYSLIWQLKEVLASDDDLTLAQSQKDNREEIEDSFLTGSSGSTSLGASDFVDLAAVGGTIRDSLSLDGNATIVSFTSGLAAADSAGQGWFSEETRSQLDAISSTVTYSLRDPDPYNMAGWEDRYYWLLGDDE